MDIDAYVRSKLIPDNVKYPIEKNIKCFSYEQVKDLLTHEVTERLKLVEKLETLEKDRDLLSGSNPSVSDALESIKKSIKSIEFDVYLLSNR